MKWFWNRHATCDARISALEVEVGKLASLVRQARADASEASERAYKYLKRSEARARREADDTEAVANQGQPAVLPAATPLPPSVTWGARARIAARRARRPALGASSMEDETNGVHS